MSTELRYRVSRADLLESDAQWSSLIVECLTGAAMSIVPDRTREMGELAETLWAIRYGEVDPLAGNFTGSDEERWIVVLIRQAAQGCSQAASRALTLFARQP